MRVKGSTAEVLTDVALAAKCVYQEVLCLELPEEEAKKALMHAIETALLSPEELAKRMVKQALDMIEKIGKEEKGEGDE